MKEGTRHSAVSRRRISAGLLGHRVSEETRERMRAARAKFLRKQKRNRRKK